VLPVLAASLLTDEAVLVPNAPDLADVRTMLSLLGDMGGEVERGARGVSVRFRNDPEVRAPWEHVRRMRGSVCVLGPLLGRRGRAEVSLPGGCVFGMRPIDVHLKGMEALGAKVTVEHGYVVAEAPPGGLRGARVFLGTPFGSSVTGTMNVMMAAALAQGETVVENAACEPEVEDLGRCLISMGARIAGLGSPRVTIEGVERLSGSEHAVLPDRIEAGTFLVAGAITGGRVRVTGCRPDDLGALQDRFWNSGLPFERGTDWIESQPGGLGHRPKPTDVTTQPYPGFPTDLQAQWVALMALADGFSIVTERIYPERWSHLPELVRLGANIRRQGPAAVIQGTKRLSGAEVMASDLRASAALVLAGLVADGETEVHRVYHIDRGYEKIDERLRALGARIERRPDGD
jgi:UDP-N-acetylglucosamine 1-carboxyvinyltransferase